MDVYQNRDLYRNKVKAADLSFYRVQYKETDLMIGSEKNLSGQIYEAVVNTRRILDEQIENNPKFRDSLRPIRYNKKSRDIVSMMCAAAEAADVGPMAAVAGAFCFAAFEAARSDTDEFIAENGGDILIQSAFARTVALYAGDSPLSMKIGLLVEDAKAPVGICTSAGTFGHSKSFGKADMALCVSRDVLLADACATRLGNSIQTESDLKRAVENISAVKGITGAVAVLGDKIAAIGDIKLVPVTTQ